jgi:hypothetical protein
MRVAAREVSERHLEAAADGGLQMVDGARETVWRKPLRQGIGLEKGAIDLLRLGSKDTMEANAAG